MANQPYDTTDVGSAANMPSRLPAANGCDWLADVKRQLQAIERLSPGWDSHGAGQPAVATIRSAGKLIEAIAAAAGGLSKPHVHPTPSGGAQFDWQVGRRYFEIELADPSTAHYYFVDHDSNAECEGDLRLGGTLEARLSSS